MIFPAWIHPISTVMLFVCLEEDFCFSSAMALFNRAKAYPINRMEVRKTSACFFVIVIFLSFFVLV